MHENRVLKGGWFRNGGEIWMQDVIEIIQILNRYCHLADRGLVDEVLKLFAEDAKLILRLQEDEIHEGLDAIRGWYEDWKQTTWKSRAVIQHRIACPSVEVNEDKASASSYLLVVSMNRESKDLMHTIGRYEDVLVKKSGTWLFSERAIIIDLVYTLGAEPLFVRGQI